MPLSSIHPLPVNPTTGQQPLANLVGSRGVSGPPPASASGGGAGVNRDTLKSLQDVVWSDDEDDPDCLLCAEPLDISDQNFRPCQCGMQICQFCYNKLLSTDARCPGCRRPYDAKAVVFQPVDWDEVKKAKERKTRRAKTIKQLTGLGRRHLLSVRVVMKNMVYVVGMTLPAKGDEALPILRSNDYFGQYGKISRIYLRDRTALTSSSIPTLDGDDPSTSTGIYIVYIRREDAARAISALDGIPAPLGPLGRILRATYGTSRYCDAFLKGLKCEQPSCQALHEWGGESDCFTKEDMETALLRPLEYDARQKEARQRATSLSQKTGVSSISSLEDAIAGSALPNSAAWGKGVPPNRPGSRTPAAIGSSRPATKANPPTIPPLKSNAAFPLPTPSPVPAPIVREKKNKASATAMGRGRSSDSTQSTKSGTGTSSSNQPSPKKRPSALSNVLDSMDPDSVMSNGSGPPGLEGETKRGYVNGDAHLPEDLREDTEASTSEAGPSSGSPAPQTPSRLVDGPMAPLTADPIFLHSPYEEPHHMFYPESDPAFAFHLRLDDPEIQRQVRNGYQPSPFSKTLVGLAELGIMAPEVADLLESPLHSTMNSLEMDPNDDRGDGHFSPFDGSEDLPVKENGLTHEVEDEADEPRMTSRFDFARPSSRGNSARGQSPFTLTRLAPEDEKNGWGSAGAFANGPGAIPFRNEAKHGVPAKGTAWSMGPGKMDLSANEAYVSSGLDGGANGRGRDAFDSSQTEYNGISALAQRAFDHPSNPVYPDESSTAFAPLGFNSFQFQHHNQHSTMQGFLPDPRTLSHLQAQQGGRNQTPSPLNSAAFRRF